jgi:hypothetical protein
VLTKIEDKNLFIGICTRHECAVRIEAVRPRVPLTDMRWLKEHDIAWKTSDWIIQEIGLALGQGMELIILLEEGVRPPGGCSATMNTFPSRDKTRNHHSTNCFKC